MTNHPRIDAATEHLIRETLSGRDGEVLFRVDGDSVSMEVRDGATTAPGAEHVPFAAWMADLIHTRRMSQEAMARMLGVSLKTVNRWVNGRTEPRMRELRRIQEAFGVAPPL
ncbi:MAG TPA: helix-turn-helix transcriptional regulator [Actinomycetota bacterium]|jgi:DNA-binding XRE family transcriptional regulator